MNKFSLFKKYILLLIADSSTYNENYTSLVIVVSSGNNRFILLCNFFVKIQLKDNC